MWQVILGIGIVFLLIEIFAPAMFFLNFALSAFVCAIVSFYFPNIPLLIFLFCLLSILFIYTLRPLFVKKTQDSCCKTGMEEKYVGKTAKVIEILDKNSGAITIYDERWQAKNIEDGTIAIGETVEIVSHDGLIMNVKKI